MTAEEARKLTEQAKAKLLSGSDSTVNALVDVAHKKIAEAAANGQSRVDNPFDGIRMAMTEQQQDAAYDRLRVEGYRFQASGTVRARIVW